MKKIIYFLLSVVLAFSSSALIGCGNKNSENTLFIEMVNAGYGTRWIEPLIKKFEEDHPGITVKKTEITKRSDLIMDKIYSGSTYLDLVFVEDEVLKNAGRKVVAADGTTYNTPFADLKDIFNEKVPGENVLLKDKMFDNILEQVTTIDEDGNEHFYSVPWMKSIRSIVVNKNVYTPQDGRWPRTTDEFFEFCDNLPDDITPCIHSIETSYWDSITDCWFYQYYGSEVISRWYRGYYPDDPYNEDLRYSPRMFASNGLLEAMKVEEKLVNPENGYQDKDSTLNFTAVQNKFLETKNKILFNPNGLWLEREMETNYSKDELNIEYIRIPVISALGTKLGITDEELSAIIGWVDDGKVGEAPSFTSTKSLSREEILATVEDARLINHSVSNFHSVIPVYSTKQDLAKDFLQLMVTEQGLADVYAESGSSAPFDFPVEKLEELYNEGKLSKFTYSGNMMILKGKSVCGYTDPLFTLNSLYTFNITSQSIASWFSAPDASDRKDVMSLFNENYQYVSGMWDTYLRTAGIEN